VDISLADFEGGVRNLVNDTEQAYWELSFAWRNLETANTALNSARQTWQKIHVLFEVGTKGGEAKEEAQGTAEARSAAKKGLPPLETRGGSGEVTSCVGLFTSLQLYQIVLFFFFT
jgi:outer membrane protein TolC